MANPRTLAKIAARVRERAAYCLQFEIKDPRSTFVTITKVDMKEDLRSGTIYWSCLGEEADRTKSAKMLEGAAGYIQRQVARVLVMRSMPHLSWVYDDSIAKAADLEQLIRNARERDVDIRPEAELEEGAEDESADESASEDSAKPPE
jgi:ribosome-binding factor A